MDNLEARLQQTGEREGILDIKASRQGRPHAAPVWGVWKANEFYFETDPNSVKGKNLSKSQNLVVHVQDGNDTVILEGSARGENEG